MNIKIINVELVILMIMLLLPFTVPVITMFFFGRMEEFIIISCVLNIILTVFILFAHLRG